MKNIVCKTCGSKDLICKGGSYVCKVCGSKFVEENESLNIDENAIGNLKTLAKRAFKNKEYNIAFEKFEKLLELDSKNWEHVFYSKLCGYYCGSVELNILLNSINNAIEIIGKNNLESIIEIINIIKEKVNNYFSEEELYQFALICDPIISINNDSKIINEVCDLWKQILNQYNNIKYERIDDGVFFRNRIIEIKSNLSKYTNESIPCNPMHLSTAIIVDSNNREEHLNFDNLNIETFDATETKNIIDNNTEMKKMSSGKYEIVKFNHIVPSLTRNAGYSDKISIIKFCNNGDFDITEISFELEFIGMREDHNGEIHGYNFFANLFYNDIVIKNNEISFDIYSTLCNHCKEHFMHFPITLKHIYISYYDDNAKRYNYEEVKFDDKYFNNIEKSELNNSQLTASNKTGGCYIATCVYGSYDCPEVWVLRRYRDYVLANTWYGKLFIRFYYLISPKIVLLFGETNSFKYFFRKILNKKVKKMISYGIEDTQYIDRI